MEKKPHVVITGGGFAALEALLALRALAGDRLRITVVSPGSEFIYRPAAPLEAFGASSTSLELPSVAEELGAAFHQGGVEAVAPRPKWVRLRSGMRVNYDALVLAVGARPTAGIPGALTVRDQRDLRRFARVLGDVDTGLVRRLVFALPPGRCWQLPIYELALLSAEHASHTAAGTEITIVSPEPGPLSAFGADASSLVAGLLARHGIHFVGATTCAGVARAGLLRLAGGGALAADRVIVTPELRGRRITGVPADRRGFVPTDGLGRVLGLTDVYAAGDGTAFPIKHGGVATQQADRVAHTIAHWAGAPVKSLRRGIELHALLVGGERPLFLRTELDAFGRPLAATFEHRPRSQATTTAKVFARYLTPYLEERTVAISAHSR